MLPDVRWALACLLGLTGTATALADDYGDARAELVAAYQAEDYPAMRAAAGRALAARPGYPGALFNLALAQVLDGDPAASLGTLAGLLEQRIDFGVATLPEFASLQALSGWADYAAGIEALQAPVGAAEVAWTHPAGDFVPEGIAVDPDERGAWLGSIRFGTVRRLGEGAGITAVPGPHWSVYGMRLHGDRLWFVSAAVEQFAALDPAEAGRSGLFSVALSDGQVTAEMLLPRAETPQVLGDLAFGPQGEVYLSDQSGGIVYRYVIETGELSEVTAPGVLKSPQGIVPGGDDRYLYAADYVGGLFRIDRRSGTLAPVVADPLTCLFGIDGLYRHGDSLVAIQNGIRPHRVVQLHLSDDGLQVTASRILAMNLPEFDEPNLGQVIGENFYFIANSHWNRFDPEGNLPPDLVGPIVMRVGLGPAPSAGE